MVPCVLTCLIGRRLGGEVGPLDHFDLRDLAASILAHLCRHFSKASTTLKPRLARSCLKAFLDPQKPFGTHYGAILGLRAAGGSDAVRVLIVPNLREYESLIRDELTITKSGGEEKSSTPRSEADRVLGAILNVLAALIGDDVIPLPMPLMNGHTDDAASEIRAKLVEKVGEVIGGTIADSGHLQLAQAVIDSSSLAL